MWYTKNLRIAQVNNALQNFKDLLKANEYTGLSDLVIGVDGYDPKDENKMFTFTLNNQQKAETNINKVKSKNLELNTAANSASNTNTTDNSQKITIERAPDIVPEAYKFLLNEDPIKIGDNLYKIKLGDQEFQGNLRQILNVLDNEFVRIKSVQKSSGDYQLVTQNKGQKNKKLELISPKDSKERYTWDFADEYVEDYNKLIDADYRFIITVNPDNSERGYNLEISIGNIPPGVDPKFIQILKDHVVNNAVFKLATNENGDFITGKYPMYFKKKTNITPAQFQKTFITPTLINSKIGDPIKLKIDGRDIKTVRNGENVILDPNDLYLTKGKHIIEFVSNNADQNLNADKSDFLSYQINVTDGQKLSLIGSARGSFPNLYNRAPPSTERQRIEQRVKDQRKAPTQETPDEEEGIQEKLRTEATTNGLLTRVYNTAMQKYDFNEVEQYIEEIMRNRALYATPQKRKDYAESLKRERGRVRQQSSVDALMQPRPPGA